MGEKRNAYKILVGNVKKRDHSEDTGVNGKIIFEWILGKQEWDVSGSGKGPVTGCFERGNEPWGSIKGGEFLE
jgi:hypothetical protein